MYTTDRYKDAPWFKKSCSEEIIVGGVGGIGSNALYYLTKTIPATYYIVDPDAVEVHNIGTQFFKTSQLHESKVEAARTNCIEFGTLAIIRTIVGGIDDNILPIAISGFDNMAARKEMFNNWKNRPNREIFIDGRLSANIYQIFTVLPGREEAYEKTLFNDADVSDGPCTFKQTAYFAGLIGARITHILVNYLTNKHMNDEIANIPFKIEEIGDPFVINIDYGNI